VAALRSLPFGTLVQATAIESRQSISVRLNDRGRVRHLRPALNCYLCATYADFSMQANRHKPLKKLADSTRFERATFAYGGQFREAAGLCERLLVNDKPLMWQRVGIALA
jgi:hypothetical protein